MSKERQVVIDKMYEQIETLILMHGRAEWSGVAIQLIYQKPLGTKSYQGGGKMR